MWSINANSIISSENGERRLTYMQQQKSPSSGLLESKSALQQQLRRPFQSVNANTTPRTDGSRNLMKFSKDAKMVKPQHYAPELMVLPHGELDDESSTMSAQGQFDGKTYGQRISEEFAAGIFREQSDTNELLDDLWLLKRANPVFDSDDEDDGNCE